MPTSRELDDKFWSALKSDRTMILGLDGVEDGDARPITAQAEGDKGTIWFFTARDNALVQKLELGDRAIATFASNGHDLFATLHGSVAGCVEARGRHQAVARCRPQGGLQGKRRRSGSSPVAAGAAPSRGDGHNLDRSSCCRSPIHILARSPSSLLAWSALPRAL